MKLNVNDYLRMFKAKYIDSDKWLFGLIDFLAFKNGNISYFISNNKLYGTQNSYQIKFETICRNTFIQDINQIDIFSNDIIETHSGKFRTIFEVPGGFGFECLDSDVGEFGKTYVPYESCSEEQNRSYLKDCKVVGNIFDNYNLIERFKKGIKNERKRFQKKSN